MGGGVKGLQPTPLPSDNGSENTTRKNVVLQYVKAGHEILPEIPKISG